MGSVGRAMGGEGRTIHSQAAPLVRPVDAVGWVVLAALCAGGATLLFLLAALARIIVKKKQGSWKKRHNFGVKKSWNQDRTFLSFRKPAPVTIPEKATYLKKSPSPTENKTLPGALSSDPGRGDELTLSLVEEARRIVEHQKSVDKCDAKIEENYAEKKPRIFFTVKYSFEKTALIVTINKCSNLPAKDSTNKTSDPYVKLQLLPEKQHKVKTRVVRRTLDPVYDEDFTFYGVHFNQLPILTLHFVVLSFDRYSRDDVVGEVMVELEGMDLSGSETCPLSLAREITPRSDKLRSQGRGELLVSLCHQPAASRVTVVVLKARNLPKMDITGLSDPYVKIYLMYNDQRISKKKTHVKKRTLNPVFNESFVFDLPRTDNGLAEVQLEFALLDWDRVTKNEVIGRLNLGGPKCEGLALHHWKEIQASPRRQIAEWHKLKE